MCHCEIHDQCERRGKEVLLSLGFLQDHMVLYLNITPFLASWRSYLMDLNFVTHRTEQDTQTINDPVCDPVNPLIEFGMSVDGPHMYHIEKRCRHTVIISSTFDIV